MSGNGGILSLGLENWKNQLRLSSGKTKNLSFALFNGWDVTKASFDHA
jgi:hypothetical protein